MYKFWGSFICIVFKLEVLPVLLAVWILMARLNEESILTFSYQKSSDAEDFLTFKWLCSQAHAENTFLKIHFIHVCNEEIYCMFKTFCIISVPHTECHLFHILSFSFTVIFMVNHTIKFKYQPGRLKVKVLSLQNHTYMFHQWLNKSYLHYLMFVIKRVLWDA
jgi:hypothetical protein